MTFRASFDAAVGSRQMPDAQKLLMLTKENCKKNRRRCL
jgi:hypothetical protein